jgi:hypothetical protein
MRLERHVAYKRETRNASKISIRNPEEKRSLGRPRSRSEDNINTNLKEIGCECVHWNHVCQDRVYIHPSIYYCWSHLEHRRTPWTGDQSARSLPTHKHRINANIHALSGIRTHDPKIRADEDISCLRPRGHCDWQDTDY